MLVRNIAARGLRREFTIEYQGSAGGSVEVRRGPFPFFVFSSSETMPLASGMKVLRGFFDASFELAVIPNQPLQITVR